MNLQDKQIHVERLAINNLQREVVLLVHLYSALAPGARRLDASFELTLEGEFLGNSDPALLAALTAKLEQL